MIKPNIGLCTCFISANISKNEIARCARESNYVRLFTKPSMRSMAFIMLCISVA